MKFFVVGPGQERFRERGHFLYDFLQVRTPTQLVVLKEFRPIDIKIGRILNTAIKSTEFNKGEFRVALCEGLLKGLSWCINFDDRG